MRTSWVTAYPDRMSRSGYAAVALDPAVHHKLRGVAHYLSLTSTQRVSMSEALDQLVTCWLHTVGLDPTVASAITGQPQPVPGGDSGNARPPAPRPAKRSRSTASRTGPASGS